MFNNFQPLTISTIGNTPSSDNSKVILKLKLIFPYSRSTSPPPAGQTMQQNPGSGSASGSGSGQRNFETQSPARSVDEAASALAQLLDIDQESSPPQASSAPSPMQNPNQRSGSTGSTGSSRRVYQHALSVRVPPNNPQQQQQNSGAIPRRKRQQNNTNEESS